ncbi:hypothetical protein LCGC14_1051520, partial [marine sediment metagenome]
MTKEEAIQKATQLIQTSYAFRLYWDSIWALNMAYAKGLQWRWMEPGSSGERAIKRLHNILDPRRIDVRVTYDRIGSAIRRTAAALKPQKIAWVVSARGDSPEAMISKHVSSGILKQRMMDIRALAIWRGLHKPRCVIGSMGVRRQITTNGRPVQLPVERPKKADGSSGGNYFLKNREISWSPVFPFEVIRDSSAVHLDPNLVETEFGIQQPRSLQWIKENFGVEIDTESTMGHLYSRSDQLRRATGWNLRSHAVDSKAPGVMVYEMFFKDADQEEAWPWQLFAYQDDTNETGVSLKSLHFGRNPHYGLPIHFIHYDERVLEPWAAGMPQLMKSTQDVRNMAATAMLRVLIDHYPKWVVQDGTVNY